jgi:hypothetical protein
MKTSSILLVEDNERLLRLYNATLEGEIGALLAQLSTREPNLVEL